MDQVLAPGKAQAVEQDGKHLEVVVLLIAHHIDHFVDGIFLESQVGCADVLGHIDRSAIASEQHFLVQTVFSEICPDRTIFFSEEEAFFQSFQHFVLAKQVGVRFVIDFVEADAQGPVSLVKTGIDPLVHHVPQGADFLVAGFPGTQHGMGLGHQGRGSLGFGLGLLLGLFVQTVVIGRQQALDFGLVVLVESHIAVAYQVVALLAAALGGGSVKPLFPG